MQVRFMIAATSSHSGKTIVTLGLLSALQKLGYTPTAFKVGPDYLDPQMVRDCLELPAYNLDSFFLTERALRSFLREKTGGLAVIEGVMGYYDGIGPAGYGSSYEVARITQTPVILLLDARGMYNSCLALLQGFQTYREDSNLLAVILNRTSKMTYRGLKPLLEDLGVKVLGYLPDTEYATLPPTKEKIARLGDVVLQNIDIQALLQLAETAVPLVPSARKACTKQHFTVAVARDAAFSFLYQENLECLEELGATLLFFSPLRDKALSPEVDALYLPGGYPEKYAQELSANQSMCRSIKRAVESGLPCLAEGGGFLYLHESLDGFPLVSVLNAQAYSTERVQGFGYHSMIPSADYLIGLQDKAIPTRRYHYCRSTAEGDCYMTVRAASGQKLVSGYGSATLYASFFSLYFPALPEELLNLRTQALNYRQNRESEDK